MTERLHLEVEPTTEMNNGDLYEPPRVESVLTPDALAREVQYAGRISLVDDTFV